MIVPYRINPDRTTLDDAIPYVLEATYSYRVPGVICPVCGVWGSGFFQYPTVDVSTLSQDLAQYAIPMARYPYSKPVTLETFRRIAADFEHHLGLDRVVAPGTCFGPLHGRGSGRFGDFAWMGNLTLLARESTFIEIEKAGIALTGVTADFKFRSKKQEPLVELEARPTVNLSGLIELEKCEICGRTTGAVGEIERPILEGASFQDSIPLQRVYDWPTALIVSEKFAQFIREKNLTGSVLTPVDIV